VEGRTPASVLTCLLKNYHPGLVEYKGKTVVASTWKHYEATTAADVVSNGFWVSFVQMYHCCSLLIVCLFCAYNY
jgi:hypothetical protein